ncbi:MAG: tRNA uridine-5-carboxymethylaminomethyl(34) synthesis GTPase MnmE [Gammaproteobacteria bacterium]|nr:tRNA uridine-5-carboxymethylaminomethyl(34) synthesis GTPase MnmE [Gammaproteobacteria bacterium]
MIRSDTIVASATAPGRGAISIIRLSGPKSTEIAKILSGKSLKPRIATFGSITSNDEIIDTGIWIYFVAPHSFTGEDTVEFQGHGGPVVIQTILKLMTALGARLAAPGEFSQRAFLNGKIDLTQAEAISDLINASSISAVKAANNSLQGQFANHVNATVTELISLRTQIEAHIDFPDEDIEPSSIEAFSSTINHIKNDLNTLIASANDGVKLNRSAEIVLIGEPNAGKSSLLNALAKEPLAIVTDIPGTTRDLIRHDLLIDGLEIRITDTAGIRSTDDVIENEGINRAINALQTADLVLCLFDERHHKISEDTVRNLVGNTQTPIGLLRTKIDIQIDPIENHTNYPLLEISAKTGHGLTDFRNWLLEKLSLTTHSQTPFLARQRHLEHLKQAKDYIEAATHHHLAIETIDLIAEDLRLTQNALSEITGTFTSDDLLTSIFSTFCIGK